MKRALGLKCLLHENEPARFKKGPLLPALICCFLAATGYAIELGDPAPPLTINAWVKGVPVDLKNTNAIYVIEFWATWCAPCKETIPHLAELQQKLKSKNVTIIGISTEPAQRIKPFVENMGQKMNYTVAADKAETTSAAYMDAFGVDGIPEAFVVDRKGRLVWHGNPITGLDEALAQVINNTYDIEAARSLERASKLQDEYFKLVSGATQSPRADQLGNQIFTNLVKAPHALNDFAWRILTDRAIRQRDLTLALRASKSAYETTQGKSVSVTETYARALFETGNLEEAIKYQQQAVDNADKIEYKAEFDNTLNKYKRLLREKNSHRPKR
jgi:thiol-disulfide isomerase/thioredoxin